MYFVVSVSCFNKRMSWMWYFKQGFLKKFRIQMS